MEIPMVDWLSVTVDIQAYELGARNIIKELEALKKQASEFRTNHIHDKIFFNIGDQTFEVYANGAIGYAYILRNHLMEIKLAKFRSTNEDNYPIFVHFSSEFLWSFGPEKAWYWFKDWIEQNIGSVYKNKLNRVDLCCHTDCILFKMDDLNSFKGRFRNKRINIEDKDLTGFEFGSRSSGTIYLRIYDKSKEVFKKKDKLWFLEIWQKYGLEHSNVWNIEYQLNRDIFKEMKIETCEDLFNKLGILWEYLTQEWSVLVDETSTRLERSNPTKEWITLQKAYKNYQCEGFITRKKQADCHLDALLLSAMGYFTSMLALSKVNNLEEGMMKFLKDGIKALALKGKDINHIIEMKRKLYGLEVS